MLIKLLITKKNGSATFITKMTFYITESKCMFSYRDLSTEDINLFVCTWRKSTGQFPSCSSGLAGK